MYQIHLTIVSSFHESWHCSAGCPLGYNGPDCAYKCTYPYHGEDCLYKCHCTEEQCDFVFGCIAISKASKYIFFSFSKRISLQLMINTLPISIHAHVASQFPKILAR